MVMVLLAFLSGFHSETILREWRHMPFNWKHLNTLCNCFVHFTISSSRILKANIQPLIQLFSCMLQNSLNLMRKEWKMKMFHFHGNVRNKSFWSLVCGTLFTMRRHSIQFIYADDIHLLTKLNHFIVKFMIRVYCFRLELQHSATIKITFSILLYDYNDEQLLIPVNFLHQQLFYTQHKELHCCSFVSYPSIYGDHISFWYLFCSALS